MAQLASISPSRTAHFLRENIKVVWACWVNSGRKCSSTLQQRRDFFLGVQTVCTATCWRGLLILLHAVFNPCTLYNEHSVLCLSVLFFFSVIHLFTPVMSWFTLSLCMIHCHSFTFSSSHSYSLSHSLTPLFTYSAWSLSLFLSFAHSFTPLLSPR